MPCWAGLKAFLGGGRLHLGLPLCVSQCHFDISLSGITVWSDFIDVVKLILSGALMCVLCLIIEDTQHEPSTANLSFFFFLFCT